MGNGMTCKCFEKNERSETLVFENQKPDDLTLERKINELFGSDEKQK